MFIIGCHLSASRGFLHMGEEARSIGANTFQFFTRNPRGFAAKPFDASDAQAFVRFAADHHFPVIMAHAPYTLNACSADPHIREMAHEIMADDLARLAHIPGSYYNFHPGSHVQQGVETGIAYIVELLNAILAPEQNTTVLLETMAGKGSEIGRSFNELRAIIDRTAHAERLGVCLDTCHVYDAGYDIVHHLEEVLAEFDRVIGLDRLKAIHLNDSKNPFASHKDRHEKIGVGSLGTEAIASVINHPSLRDLPFYLETPNELDGYAQEINLLKSLRTE